MSGSEPFRTYQLVVDVRRQTTVRVGALGERIFPPGRYVYTGSACANFESRIRRHLKPDKPKRWHIDYLLAAPDVRIVEVLRSRLPECELNRRTGGEVTVSGFGSSDCRRGCGSHLKRTGPRGQAGR